MDSDLTSYNYTISVLGPTGWMVRWQCKELGTALEWFDDSVEINPYDAYRVFENHTSLNGVGFHVIAEHFPSSVMTYGEDHGPVKEPISWAEEGF